MAENKYPPSPPPPDHVQSVSWCYGELSCCQRQEGQGRNVCTLLFSLPLPNAVCPCLCLGHTDPLPSLPTAIGVKSYSPKDATAVLTTLKRGTPNSSTALKTLIAKVMPNKGGVYCCQSRLFKQAESNNSEFDQSDVQPWPDCTKQNRKLHSQNQ